MRGIPNPSRNMKTDTIPAPLAPLAPEWGIVRGIDLESVYGYQAFLDQGRLFVTVRCNRLTGDYTLTVLHYVDDGDGHGYSREAASDSLELPTLEQVAGAIRYARATLLSPV